MSKPFKRIGVIATQRTHKKITETLASLYHYLKNSALDITVDTETAALLPDEKLRICSHQELGSYCDLIIVVGGDGSFLNAARAALIHDVPIIGINRGRLGFLTDIRPNEMADQLTAVLSGDYIEEARFLLEAQIYHEKKMITSDTALNDAVLSSGGATRMIEFEIYIDDDFVSSQHADGIIVATPTGSTAYALSGGGPIIHPNLDAVVLVPMFSHTLSSRPIVVDGNSEIKIVITHENETTPRFSCDGQTPLSLMPGHTIQIKKKEQKLRLIHPLDYRYFETLRDKLHWNKKPAG